MKIERVKVVACALIAAGLTTLATAQSANDEARSRAYGKRLSPQCTTCHRLDGTDNGVPSISGWAAEDFIFVLKAYRDGGRPEPAAAAGAHRLDENQMKALASYFGSLKPKGPSLR